MIRTYIGQRLAALSPALRQGQGPLAQIIREDRLHCVFQPLGDLQSGSKSAAGTLSQLGLGVEDLAGLKGDQAFAVLAEAVAIKDGVIVAIGTTAEVREACDATTQVLSGC